MQRPAKIHIWLRLYELSIQSHTWLGSVRLYLDGFDLFVSIDAENKVLPTLKFRYHAAQCPGLQRTRPSSCRSR